VSDVLLRATRELRHAPVSHDQALLTLARLTHPEKRARGRSRRWIAMVLPIAATLVALGAWADATREKTRATLSAPTGGEREVAHTTVARTGVLPLPAPLPPLPPPATATTTVAPPKIVTAPAPVAPTPVATIVVTAAPPDPDALYRRAFEAYRDHDDAAALAAWDAYLAGAGSAARFAPEARFGRAAALVRLGRKDEARAALAPFARGDYGDYRRDEARALLRRL